MLHLIRADDAKETVRQLRMEGARNLVIVHNINSMTLMAWVAKKLVADLSCSVFLICSTKEGWSDFEKLAEECGHSHGDWSVVDPNLN